VFAGKTGFTELFSGSYYDAKRPELLHLRFTRQIRQRTKNKTQNLAGAVSLIGILAKNA